MVTAEFPPGFEASSCRGDSRPNILIFSTNSAADHRCCKGRGGGQEKLSYHCMEDWITDKNVRKISNIVHLWNQSHPGSACLEGWKISHQRRSQECESASPARTEEERDMQENGHFPERMHISVECTSLTDEKEIMTLYLRIRFNLC